MVLALQVESKSAQINKVQIILKRNITMDIIKS